MGKPRSADSSLARNRHTKIDGIDSKLLQALVAALFAIACRGIDFERLTPLHKAEFAGNKDVVPLSRPFKPFADEYFTALVQTGISNQRYQDV